MPGVRNGVGRWEKVKELSQSLQISLYWGNPLGYDQPVYRSVLAFTSSLRWAQRSARGEGLAYCQDFLLSMHPALGFFNSSLHIGASEWPDSPNKPFPCSPRAGSAPLCASTPVFPQVAVILLPYSVFKECFPPWVSSV